MKRKGLGMNTVLLLTLTGTVLLVLLSAIFLFYRAYQRSLIRNAETNSQRSIVQVSNTVNDYLVEINKVMAILEESLEDQGMEREEFFDVFLRIRPDVVAVSTYDGNGALLNCYSLLGSVMPGLEENLSFQADRMDQYEEGFVSAPHVVSLFEGAYPWVVTMISPLNRSGTEKWVALDISCSNISSYINDVGIGQRGYCFLMDVDGNIVYHPQQQLIYSDLKRENTELIASLDDGSHVEGSVIYTVQSLANGRWQVVGVSFVQEIINESLRDMSRILMLAGVLFLIAVLVISVIISRALSRPIRNLATAMEQFEQNAGAFTYTPAGGVRELRTLSESFSHMVLRLQNLVETVRSEQINLRKTELRALQAQINPHFLYNTLDCIRGEALEAGMDDIASMVESLSSFFRYSISSGDILVQLRDELRSIQIYYQIQRYRFRDRFRLEVECEDERALDCYLPKLTLQPIMENCILHGLELKEADGLIRIHVTLTDRRLIVTVSDNGCGMSPNDLERLREKINSPVSPESERGMVRHGIAVRNINKQLKLLFGPAYGLSVSSRLGEGTEVEIQIPAVDQRRALRYSESGI